MPSSTTTSSRPMSLSSSSTTRDRSHRGCTRTRAARAMRPALRARVDDVAWRDDGTGATMTPVTPFDDAAAAADELRERTGHDRHDVAVVLGSGWATAADHLGAPDVELSMAEVTGFPQPS